MRTLSTHRGAALLIDMIVAVAIFALLFGGILNGLRQIAAAQIELKSNLAATFLMSQQFERAESIDYTSVGIVGATGSIPVGIFPSSENITENNTVFTRTTTVRYIDDPHDGTGASDTNSKPNDYKQMSVTISWNTKDKPRSVKGSRYYAPPGIEP